MITAIAKPNETYYKYSTMDKRFLLNRYSHYYKHLQTLGQIPLNINATVEMIEPTRGLVQSCYKEMRNLGFNDTLIDYLCWISSTYLLDTIKNFNLTEREEMTNTLDKYADHIYKIVMINPNEPLANDVFNFLRLFHKKPDYFFSFVYDSENWVKESSPNNDEIKAYQYLSQLWFHLYRKGVLTKENRIN